LLTPIHMLAPLTEAELVLVAMGLEDTASE
jgi:hypothetical protein